MQKFLILSILLISSACIKVSDGDVKSGSVAITSKSYFNCTNNATESTAFLYTFKSDGKYVLEIMFYDANNCTVASKRERNYIYGEYTFNPTTGDFTDRSYKLEIIPLTAADVLSKNGASDCGFTDWTIDVAKDATDNNFCAGGTIYTTTPAFTFQATFNDSIYDDGNTIFTRVNP